MPLGCRAQRLAKLGDASQGKRETNDPEADSAGHGHGWVAPLWKGRIYHLKGRFTGSPNVISATSLHAFRRMISAALRTRKS